MDELVSQKLGQFIKENEQILKSHIKGYAFIHKKNLSIDDVISYLYESLCESKRLPHLVDHPKELIEYSKRILWTVCKGNRIYEKHHNSSFGYSSLNENDTLDDLDEDKKSEPAVRSIFDDDNTGLSMFDHFKEIKQEFIISLAPWEQVIWEYRFEQFKSREWIAEKYNTAPKSLDFVTRKIYKKLRLFLKDRRISKHKLYDLQLPK